MSLNKLRPILFLWVLLLSTQVVFSGDENETSGHNGQDKKNEAKKGERLFYSPTLLGTEGKSCVSCHSTVYTDELVWDPSALDIAQKYNSKSIEDLVKVLNKPTGKMLTEVHKGLEVSNNQARFIKSYFTKLVDEGQMPYRRSYGNLLLFILAGLLGVAAIADFVYFGKIKFKAIHILIVLFVTVYSLKVLVIEGIASGRQKDYAPVQPIKFSHKIHAGENGTDCKYCHSIVEDSKHSGIPEVGTCMNCHSIIAEGTNSGKFEIAKIRDAYENGTPVEWVKIHNLPDHVYFSHAQHVGAGKLDCAECHGPVEEMDVVKQHTDMSMGWCLDCHKTRKVQFADNEYYNETFVEYHDKLVKGEIDSITVAEIGGTNCMKCHY